MIHKKLLVALFSILSTSVLADDTASLAETSSSAEGDTWNQETPCNTQSFGFFKIGVGFFSANTNYKNTTSINKQAEYLDTEKQNINPNYGDNMELGTEEEQSTASSPLGSFEFGYNAALGQTRAMLGFFAGLNVMNASREIPLTLSYYDYDYDPDNPNNQEDWVQKTDNYTTILKSNISFNAGLTLGMKVTDRTFAFLKAGWTCARISSTKLNENQEQADSTDKEKDNKGFGSKYLNGFIYGGGIDFMVTERVAIGVEAFGTIYGDEKVTLFNLESVPDENIVGSSKSTQSLIADPLSLNSWGVMATVKIIFSER